MMRSRGYLALCLTVIVAGLPAAGSACDTGARTSRATATPAATPTTESGALMDGRITSIEDGVLTIGQATGSIGGPTRLAVQLDSATLIRRAVGSAPSISVVAGNDIPLRVGDLIEVSGPMQDGRSIRAEEIQVSPFMTRDGIVTAVGPDYFDIRLRKDRLSDDFFEESRRVWLPTALEIKSLKLNCGTSIPLRHLKIGEDAAFQGLLADDSSMVAVCLFG